MQSWSIWKMLRFDRNMPEKAVRTLEKHFDFLKNAFTGEDLFWRFDHASDGNCLLLAHQGEPTGRCIAVIPLRDLQEIQDVDELQLKIITGEYQP